MLLREKEGKGEWKPRSLMERKRGRGGAEMFRKKKKKKTRPNADNS